MKEIRISGGKYVALIDDEDYQSVTQHSWYIFHSMDRLYARRILERRSSQLMHTYITGFKQVDHINRNGLDNQRCNLRAANHVQNQGNVALRKNNTSGFRGIAYHKRKKDTKKWSASIKKNYVLVFLGYFETKEEAAKAYDLAAKEYFGDFAFLNFP